MALIVTLGIIDMNEPTAMEMNTRISTRTHKERDELKAAEQATGISCALVVQERRL
jgi:hypothetical protein